MYTGGGLLRAADDAGGHSVPSTMCAKDEVGAVVERQGRVHRQGLVDAPVELVGGKAVPSVDRGSFRRQRRGYVVLGGQRIAARPRHLRARVAQGADQDRRLLGHMQATGDPHSGQRHRLAMKPTQVLEHGHARLGPAELQRALIGERGVFDPVCCHAVSVVPSASPVDRPSQISTARAVREAPDVALSYRL